MATIPNQTQSQAQINNLQTAPPFTSRAPGLAFDRHFTKPGVSPYDEIVWELRDAIIQDYKGRTIFEQKNVEVPADWSMTATNIVASKYLHGQIGTPERESGVRALITRVAESIRDWGIAGGYFATPAGCGDVLRRACAPAAEPEGRVQLAGVVQRGLRPAGAEFGCAELALERATRRGGVFGDGLLASRSARRASSIRCRIRWTRS